MRYGASQFGRSRRFNMLINEQTTEIQHGDDCLLIGHARSWQGRIPAIHGAIRLGQSLALPESRKAV